MYLGGGGGGGGEKRLQRIKLLSLPILWSLNFAANLKSNLYCGLNWVKYDVKNIVNTNEGE